MSRITTPFDATTTAAEVLRGIDLTGLRVIVTGGAAGIGAATSAALVGAGASVVLAVRRPEQGERTAGRLRADVPGASVEVRPLDLADRASVRAFVAGWTGPLDVVIGNAGVMATPEPGRRRAGSCSSPRTTSGTTVWSPASVTPCAPGRTGPDAPHGSSR